MQNNTPFTYIENLNYLNITQRYAEKYTFHFYRKPYLLETKDA
jgi:hypothetical protein